MFPVMKGAKAAGKKINAENISAIYAAGAASMVELPLYQTKISAGFPSPAEDYIESRLDLNEYLISHPSATFFVRVMGDSMIRAGIDTGDMLIVDRSLNAANFSIIVAVLNGEFTVKRLVIRNGKYYLVPENEKYTEIEIKEEMEFEIWGVVTKILKDPV